MITWWDMFSCEVFSIMKQLTCTYNTRDSTNRRNTWSPARNMCPHCLEHWWQTKYKCQQWIAEQENEKVLQEQHKSTSWDKYLTFSSRRHTCPTRLGSVLIPASSITWLFFQLLISLRSFSYQYPPVFVCVGCVCARNTCFGWERDGIRMGDWSLENRKGCKMTWLYPPNV